MLAHDLSRALDPLAFATDCGLPDLDEWQSELLAGDHRRALLLCCRQAGKSTITALLALWIAIYEAPTLILLVSPSQRQSAELFRRVLGFFHRLHGAPEIELESVLKLELRNGSRIISLPGSETTVRGYSAARLVVIDEAARVPDDLLAAIRPTLATSTNGRLIALSTPFGRRGWFFDAWEHGGPDWHRVMVTADQCQRISPAFLDQERRELGELRYSEEYGCQFVDADTQIFASETIEAAFTSEGGAAMDLIDFRLAEPARQFVVPERRYVLGVDLGQSLDPTAVCVLEHHTDPSGEWEAVTASRSREIPAVRYDVRHLERLPLRTPYPAIVEHVAALLERPPLIGNVELVVDQSGVGAPVADLFQEAGLWPIRVTITAGSEPNGRGNRWMVPKHALISTLDAKLATAELRFASDLAEGQALASELGDFRRKVSEAGRASYQARTGRHDDLVLAVAIARWWAARPVPDVGMIRLGGIY